MIPTCLLKFRSDFNLSVMIYDLNKIKINEKLHIS